MKSIDKALPDSPVSTPETVALSPIADTPETELAKLLARLAERDSLIKSKDSIIHAQELQIQMLMQEIAHLRRMRFGVKSEALGPEQMELFTEDLNQDIAAVTAELEAIAPVAAATRKRARAGRQPLPPHLERVEVRHEPESCTCAVCQQALVKIGEDVSEQLDIVPAKFFVVRHIRPQYACRHCETITAAPVAPAVIDGGVAATDLLVWVVICKYLDHLPLYRVEQIAARQQVPLPRSNLSEWIGRIGVSLQPLADRLRELLRERGVLHADETPVQQLDPGAGKTRRAYLWTYRSNDLDTGPPLVVFDYQESRSGQHAQGFLGDWRGSLLVDDYAGYKALFAGAQVTELGCWAHARRKFFDLQAANPHPQATEALRRIGLLYAAESEARELGVAERAAYRQAHSVPVLEALYSWLQELRIKTADGSGLARAIDYTLRRWDSLNRYAATGNLPIDNNPVENAIRPIALGKKNWLFAGSKRAGMRAAAIQSLLATAKLNGIEPAAWLKDTLEKLPVWSNKRLDELLPLRKVPDSA